LKSFTQGRRPSAASSLTSRTTDFSTSTSQSLLPALASDQRNYRHMHTCREGWAFLDQQVWSKLTAFETFVREWFGFDESKKNRVQIVYHDDANRMYICVLCPETNVTLSLSRDFRSRMFRRSSGFEHLDFLVLAAVLAAVPVLLAFCFPFLKAYLQHPSLLPTFDEFVVLLVISDVASRLFAGHWKSS
jgi:hypothetical protein